MVLWIDSVEGRKLAEEGTGVQESSITLYDLEDSDDSNIEPAKLRVGLTGWEAKMADKPYVYATFMTTLDLLPFARYAAPSHMEEFDQLSDRDKITAMFWESVGAGLFLGAGPITRVVGKAGKKVFGKKAPKIQPIEDAVHGINLKSQKFMWESFNYETAVRNNLKKMKFADDEVDTVVDVVMGANPDRLKDVVITKRLAEQKFSEGWKKHIKFSGKAYGGLHIDPKIMKNFDQKMLRQKYQTRQYKRALSTEVLGGTQKNINKMADASFRHQMTKFFGAEAAKTAKLGELSEETAANLIADLVRHPRSIRSLASPGPKGIWPASLTPIRTTMGSGEASYGTFTGIYRPVTGAFRKVNEYTFFKIQEWLKALEQRGLGKLKSTRFGDLRFRPAKHFTPTHMQEAYRALVFIDNLFRKLPKKTTPEIKATLEAINKEAERIAAGLSQPAKALFDTWKEFSDSLFAEHMQNAIARAFETAPLTDYGTRMVNAMRRVGDKSIMETFSTTRGLSPAQKIMEIKSIFDFYKSKLNLGNMDVHPWFSTTGRPLKEIVKDVKKQLTLQSEGGEHMNYLGNYVARLSQKGKSLELEWENKLVGRMKAFYTKARKLEARKGAPVDFASMIEARVRAQGKELKLYDELSKVVRFAEGLPAAWREYTEHFLARALNKPSFTDYKVARLLERVSDLPGMKWLGDWDEYRVMRLGQTINNFTYMGALGFKPFSAARNLFQPLINVPLDMGGVKGYGRLVQGFQKSFDKETRKYLQKIGVITDYAPEATIRPHAMPWSKTFKFRGKERAIPRSDRVRDFAMWMFRGSDRYNRYVTGGAAIAQWDDAAKGFLRHKNVDTFIKKVGATKRHPWIRTEIEDFVRRGKWDEAKAIYVRDVVADTQYLYGALESPSITGRGGIFGKTGFVFQTWWMNYGALLNKALTVGSPGVRAERMFTWMTSQAIAITLMSELWGIQRAKRSTFLGPFPGPFNEFILPPSWTPIAEAIMTIKEAGVGDFELSAERAKRILSSSVVGVPAGLQIKAMHRRFQEEGWAGAGQELLGYRPDKKGGIITRSLK